MTTMQGRVADLRHMVRPVRLQLSRKRGFNLQEHSLAVNGLPAVNCARPSKWGNPFCVGRAIDKAQVRLWGWKFKHPEFVTPDAETAKRRFAACVCLDEAIHNHIRDRLGGKNLACFCELDAPCHADVLLELANGPVCEEIDANPLPRMVRR